jgi:hypothetical protein
MATVCFVDFLLVTVNEMEEHYNISDEVFRKSNEATGSPISTKSSERYNKDYRLFCKWKENAVNEVNEEVMLAYLFDKVGKFVFSNSLVIGEILISLVIV